MSKKCPYCIKMKNELESVRAEAQKLYVRFRHSENQHLIDKKRLMEALEVGASNRVALANKDIEISEANERIESFNSRPWWQRIGGRV